MIILYLIYCLSYFEVYLKGLKVCICYLYKGLLWILLLKIGFKDDKFIFWNSLNIV